MAVQVVAVDSQGIGHCGAPTGISGKRGVPVVSVRISGRKKNEYRDVYIIYLFIRFTINSKTI